MRGATGRPQCSSPRTGVGGGSCRRQHITTCPATGQALYLGGSSPPQELSKAVESQLWDHAPRVDLLPDCRYHTAIVAPGSPCHCDDPRQGPAVGSSSRQSTLAAKLRQVWPPAWRGTPSTPQARRHLRRLAAGPARAPAPDSVRHAHLPAMLWGIAADLAHSPEQRRVRAPVAPVRRPPGCALPQRARPSNASQPAAALLHGSRAHS